MRSYAADRQSSLAVQALPVSLQVLADHDRCVLRAGCILISFSTPITFWFYSRMVDGFDASGDEDLVSSTSTADGRKAQNHALPLKQVAGLVAFALLCSTATIIGPAELIPVCAAKDMRVKCLYFGIVAVSLAPPSSFPSAAPRT